MAIPSVYGNAPVDCWRSLYCSAQRRFAVLKKDHDQTVKNYLEFKVKRDNILRQAVHAQPELVERAAERIQSYMVKERLHE